MRVVVFDDTIVKQAGREALKRRGLSVITVPPADPAAPAHSVLGTALNDRLRDAGIRVTTTSVLVDQAFDALEAEVGEGHKTDLLAVEDAFWSQLGGAVDSNDDEADPADDGSPCGPYLAEAIRVLDADVVVTHRPDLIRAGEIDGVVFVPPPVWLRFADDEVRRLRRDETEASSPL